MIKRDETTYINARIYYVTEKAIQIQPAFQEERFWLPKSQVLNVADIMDYLTTLPQEQAKREYVELECKEWIVNKNGIPDGYRSPEEIPF